MKTEEDEAFDDLARKQGMWGGGFNAKRQAAMDKVNSHFDAEYKKMHEDRAMYGSSWSKNGERIDPMSVYLEEPAQEPTGMLHIDRLGQWLDASLKERKQREWVGLTDEETQAYWDWEDWQTGAGRSTIFEMVRDIEAKLKRKNT